MCVSEQPNRKSLLPSGFVVWLWLWCSLLAMYALFVLFFFLFFGNIYLFIQTCRDQSPICLLFTHTKRLSDVYVVLSTVSKCKSRCLIQVLCVKHILEEMAMWETEKKCIRKKSVEKSCETLTLSKWPNKLKKQAIHYVTQNQVSFWFCIIGQLCVCFFFLFFFVLLHFLFNRRFFRLLLLLLLLFGWCRIVIVCSSSGGRQLLLFEWMGKHWYSSSTNRLYICKCGMNE